MVRESRALPLCALSCSRCGVSFSSDIDCVGNSGKNVGFTVSRDEDNVPTHVQAIKIDPGYAFTNCPRTHMDSAGFRALQLKSLEELRTFVVPLGTTQSTRFAALPPSVQSEFLECVRDISNTTAGQLEQFFCREGLEPLFIDDSSIQQRVVFLEERRAAIMETYTPLLLLHHIVQPGCAADCEQMVRAKYSRDAVLRDPVTGSQLPIEERLVNLALLQERIDSGDGADTGAAVARKGAAGGRRNLASSFDAIRAKKVDIQLKDLLSKCVGGTKRINMKGGAGYGKSTCCQCMLLQWAKGLLFTEFKLVVLVPLRNLTSSRYPDGDKYDVVDIIIQEALCMQSSPELRAVVAGMYSESSTLWVLDGYDEIVDRVPEHLQAAYTSLMSAKNRILTGRPHAMQGVPADLHVEVAGFRDDNITEFVERFCATVGTAVTPAALLAYLRGQALLWDLAHVPISLVMTCHVLSQPAALARHGDMTMTELYTEMEAVLLRRYCQKQGENLERLTPARHKEMAQIVAVVSGVAFDAMLAGSVIIPGYALFDWMLDVGMLTGDDAAGDAAAWQQLLTSGIVVQAQGDAAAPQDGLYHFLHLTVQEYFAGRHLARLCALGVSKHFVWLQTNKYMRRLEVMWWFAGGLLGRALDGEVTGLETFTGLWTGAPRDAGRQTETRILLRVIEEGRLFRLPDDFSAVATKALVSQVNSTVLDAVHGVLVSKTTRMLDLPWLDVLSDCPSWCATVALPFLRSLAFPSSALCDEAEDVRRLFGMLARSLGPRLVEDAAILALLQAGISHPDARVRQSTFSLLAAMGLQLGTLPWMEDWIRSCAAPGTPEDAVLASFQLVGQFSQSNAYPSLVQALLQVGLQSTAVRSACMKLLRSCGLLFLSPEFLRRWFEAAAADPATVDITSCALQLLPRLGLEWYSTSLAHELMPAALRSTEREVRLTAFQMVRALNPTSGSKLDVAWVASWVTAVLSVREPQTVDADAEGCVADVLINDGGALVLSSVKAVMTWIMFRLGSSAPTVPDAVVRVLKGTSPAALESELLTTLIHSWVAPPDAASVTAEHRTRRLITVLPCFPLDAVLRRLPWLPSWLQTALRSMDGTVRQQAAFVAKHLGPGIAALPWFPTCLSSLLSHGVVHVRVTGAELVRDLGAPLLHVPPVQRWIMAQRESEHINERVLVLAIIHAAGMQIMSFPDLFTALQSVREDEHSAMKLQMLRLMQRIPVSAYVEGKCDTFLDSLSNFFQRNELEVRDEAVSMLVQLGPQLLEADRFLRVLPSLLRLGDPDIALFRLVRAFSVGDGLHTVPAFVSYVEVCAASGVPAIRAEAASFLCDLGSRILRVSRFIPLLCTLAQSDNVQQAFAALDAIDATHGEFMSVPPLVDAVWLALNHVSPRVQARAAKLVGSLGGARLEAFKPACLLPFLEDGARVGSEPACDILMAWYHSSDTHDDSPLFTFARNRIMADESFRREAALQTPMSVLSWDWLFAWVLESLSATVTDSHCAACDVLERLGSCALERPELFSALLHNVDSPTARPIAVRLLAACGPRVLCSPMLVTLLVGCLEDADAVVAWSAGDAVKSVLAQLDEDALPLCTECFQPSVLYLVSTVGAVTFDSGVFAMDTPAGRFVQVCDASSSAAVSAALASAAGAPPRLTLQLSEAQVLAALARFEDIPVTTCVSGSLVSVFVTLASAASSSEKVWAKWCCVVRTRCAASAVPEVLSAFCRASLGPLVECLQRFAGNTALLCDVLHALSLLFPAMLEPEFGTFLRSDGLNLLVSSLLVRGGVADAVACFSALAANKRCEKLLLSSGVIDVLCERMVSSVASVSVLVPMCSALCSVAVGAAVKERVLQGPSKDVLGKIVATHMRDEAVMRAITPSFAGQLGTVIASTKVVPGRVAQSMTTFDVCTSFEGEHVLVLLSPGSEVVLLSFPSLQRYGITPLARNTTARGVCGSPRGFLYTQADRVQELTLDGTALQQTPARVEGRLAGPIAFANDMFAALCLQPEKRSSASVPVVVLYSYCDFQIVRSFGPPGSELGQLSTLATGIRLSHDGGLVYVSEAESNRVSVFATGSGEFVRCYGVGVLADPVDVLVLRSGDVLVANISDGKLHCFARDAVSTRLLCWGLDGMVAPVSLCEAPDGGVLVLDAAQLSLFHVV